jgi:hypothetical protein
VYQPLAGDGDFIARLADLPTTENPFQAGLTIRQGLDPAADEVSLMVHPGGVPHLNSRPVNGAGRSPPAESKIPCNWVRLIRAGDVFIAFYSADGQSWLPVGTRRVKMNGPVYAGLACAATVNENLASATFDHVLVRFEPMGPARGFALVDGSLIAAQVRRFDAKKVTYADSAGAEHTLPAEWVAYIFNQPLPPDMRGKLLAVKIGLCLVNGDSVEGDVRGLIDGQVAVVSLVFGPQNTKFSQVATVVLRQVVAKGSFSLDCNDGSIYRCQAVNVADGIITAETATMGTMNVKAMDLVGVIAEVPRP